MQLLEGLRSHDVESGFYFNCIQKPLEDFEQGSDHHTCVFKNHAGSEERGNI